MVVTLGWLGLLGAAPACDDLDGDQRGALSVTAVEQHPDAGTSTGVDDQDAGSSGDCGDYDVMCRHYCEALRETGFYFCVASGEDAETCTAQGSFYDQCYDLRCAPRLVKQPLCLTQCDSLAAEYGPYCASPTADPALCATAPDEHDRACRSGCGHCLIP